MSPIALSLHRTDETDPRRRGRELGRRWARAIGQAWRDYEQLFELKGLTAAEVEEFAAATLDATAEWAPDIYAELAGVAVGADQPAWLVGALTCRTELLARGDRVGASECTTVVHVPADGTEPRTLQTWDWLAELASEALIVAMPGPDGRALRFFTEFGMPAKIGTSSAGLGVHFNILHHESDGADAGVPLHVVVRRILGEAETVADAVELARSATVSASSAITVAVAPRAGSAAEAATIELCPAGVAALAFGAGETLARANTFITPELAAGDRTPGWSNSRDRAAAFGRDEAGARLPDALARAQALAVDPATGERSIACLFPDPAAGLDMSWETKLTVALRFEPAGIEYSVGAPSAASRESWAAFG